MKTICTSRIYSIFNLFIWLFFSSSSVAGDLTVHINGLNKETGKLYISLCNGEDFNSRCDYEYARIVNTRSIRAIFTDVPHGTYAVQAFHDRNSNGKLDTNIFGAPEEPIAVSNDAKGDRGPASFNDAAFKVTGEDKTISVTLY